MNGRLLPDGIAGRFALLLSAALIAANMIAVIVLAIDRIDGDRRMDESLEVERILALVPAMEAVSRPVRDRIARDASTRLARITVGPTPRVVQTAADTRSRMLAKRISTALGARDVNVAIVDRPPRTEDGRRWRGRAPILISIPLAGDGRQWLNVVTSGAPARAGDIPSGPILTALGLSLASVLAVAILFARRLTKPLGDLADAAAAAGRGDRTVRVAEDGAKEVRAAAAAFNAMQGKIAQFDAERMRMFAAVGHDLRTPMTSLRIRTEMIDDAELRDPMIRTLDEMTVMADSLVSFAQDSRDAEASGPVDLAGLLARICSDRGAIFTGGDAVKVRGRPVALGRLFGNLVDNAVRYGGSATVTLLSKGGDAVVHVDDAGPGIPPERMDSLFQPFTRGEVSRNLDTGGAGLGLSIARSIAMTHGGRIALQNKATGGLRAVVTLPRV